MNMEYVVDTKVDGSSSVKVIPITGTFGAYVDSYDLAQPFTDGTPKFLKGLLHEYKVLIFRDQRSVGPRDLLALGKIFGSPETEHPTWPNVVGFPGVQQLSSNMRDALEDTWHTDGATRSSPKCITVLQAVDVPNYGRDTIFADMEAAFADLSRPMQQFLEGLTALHSWGVQKPDAAPVEHPVVMVDPVNGRKALYVNQLYTRSIVGLRKDESAHLLRLLYNQTHFGEHQLRVSWEPKAVVIWDNMKTQHYLVRDREYKRIMYRVLAL